MSLTTLSTEELTTKGRVVLRIIEKEFISNYFELAVYPGKAGYTLIIDKAKYIYFEMDAFKWKQFKKVIKNTIDGNMDCSICMGSSTPFYLGCCACFNVVCMDCKLADQGMEVCPFCRCPNFGEHADGETLGLFHIKL